jgi:glycosyltransferase involved in cell wall biosynthesis
MPGIWRALEHARGEDVRTVYQALLLAKAVRLRGIGHLHAHFGNVAAAVARLASRFSGVPYSFTAHAKDIFHESVRPDDLRRKLQDAEAVVTVSDFNLDYLMETYGSAALGVHRVYNGLDLRHLPFMLPEQRPPVVLSVGRLVEKKGFADLIDACAILALKGCDFRCEIIGTGELEAELRAQIERLGLGDKVEMAGPHPQCEVIAHVQSAAVFAAPCVVGADGNRDGLPTVLLEAMALGTPCIATDVTGIPEVLHDGETGLMVPQHDPAALAAAIERLLSDRALGQRLAREARSLIEQSFDIHRNTATLRTLFGITEEARTGAIGGLI